MTSECLRKPTSTTPHWTRAVAVSGASGLVGSALVESLDRRGDRVTRLVRSESAVTRDCVLWDPAGGAVDAAGFEGVDAVVHLAGDGVADGRWTTAKKARIRASRVEGTRLLVDALSRVEDRPSVLVCASAVGYYGDRGDALVTEDSASGAGFLADVCRAWEAEARRVEQLGMRVVNLRFGVILSPDGGALAKMLLPFRMGAGGVLGDGGQFMSWVALPDAVRAIEHALGTPELEGPVNVVAPNPVTNREYTKSLGAAVSRPTVFPMPAFAARLAFGEMADEMLLSSTRAEPSRLLNTGFRFCHPEIGSALHELLGAHDHARAE